MTIITATIGRRCEVMTNNATTSGNRFTKVKRERSLAEFFDSFSNGFKKFWWFAILCTVLGGILGFNGYKSSYVPNYQSKATFTITAAEYDGTDESYTNNSQLAEALEVSFDYLINNEVFYEIIKEDLQISYIPSIIEINNIEDTNILSIAVSGADAKINYEVLNSVINNYSGVAEFVLGDTKLTVLEEPAMSNNITNKYDWTGAVIQWMLIGVFIGLIPSILYMLFVRRIRSKEDIEKILKLKCFGSLPYVLLNNKKGENKTHSILNKSVGFRYLEAVRTISFRCEKEFSSAKVILVTSTKRGEGKSTFSMNLAYSLSKSNKKVVLIDGDLRKPSLRKMTGAKGPGFNMGQYLDGKVSMNEGIINLAGTRVVLLAADEKTPEPIERLNSEEMKNVIEQCKDVADFIIIDSPPCGELADAAVLAKYSDCTLYIVGENCVSVSKIFEALQEFSYTRNPILGCILNNSVGSANLAYGNGGYYGYGRRYGYGRKYGGYYGRYGYGSYSGNDEYGEVRDKEFSAESRSMSRHILLTSTKEQRKAYEEKIEKEVLKRAKNSGKN